MAKLYKAEFFKRDLRYAPPWGFNRRKLVFDYLTTEKTEIMIAGRGENRAGDWTHVTDMNGAVIIKAL